MILRTSLPPAFLDREGSTGRLHTFRTGFRTGTALSTNKLMVGFREGTTQRNGAFFAPPLPEKREIGLIGEVFLFFVRLSLGHHAKRAARTEPGTKSPPSSLEFVSSTISVWPVCHGCQETGSDHDQNTKVDGLDTP